MPVTDEVSATREIRSLEAHEGRARTPIIALSANVMAHQIAEYRAVGMDAVVGKPFEAEALWSAVADLVPGGLDPATVLADPDNTVLPLNPGIELVVDGGLTVKS